MSVRDGGHRDGGRVKGRSCGHVQRKLRADPRTRPVSHRRRGFAQPTPVLGSLHSRRYLDSRSAFGIASLVWNEGGETSQPPSPPRANPVRSWDEQQWITPDDDSPLGLIPATNSIVFKCVDDKLNDRGSPHLIHVGFTRNAARPIKAPEPNTTPFHVGNRRAVTAPRRCDLTNSKESFTVNKKFYTRKVSVAPLR